MSKRSPKAGQRRFLRGAQVADVNKMAAAQARRKVRQKANTKKLRDRVVGFFKSLLGSLILLLLVVFLMSRSYIADFSGLSDEYQATVDQYFEDNGSQRFKLLLKEEQLIDDLKRTYPVIEDVHLSSPMFSNTLTIQITERTTSYIFLDSSQGRAYALDNNGVIYSSINSDQFGEYPLIKDVSGIRVNLGDAAVGLRTLSAITELVEGLPGLTLSLDAVRLDDKPQNITIELSNRGYDLLFTTARPISDQLSDAEEFLASEQGSSVDEYADFRVADKVFYK